MGPGGNHGLSFGKFRFHVSDHQLWRQFGHRGGSKGVLDFGESGKIPLRAVAAEDATSRGALFVYWYNHHVVGLGYNYVEDVYVVGSTVYIANYKGLGVFTFE